MHERARKFPFVLSTQFCSHKSHKSHFPQFSIFSSLPPSPCHRRPCSPLNCSRVILLAKARSCFWNISIVCREWWLKQDDELKSEKRCADGMSAFHFEFLKLFHPFNFTPWCLTLFVVHVEEFGGTGSVWITSEDIRDFNYCYRTITYMFGRLFNYIIKQKSLELRTKSHRVNDVYPVIVICFLNFSHFCNFLARSAHSINSPFSLHNAHTTHQSWRERARLILKLLPILTCSTRLWLEGEARGKRARSF